MIDLNIKKTAVAPNTVLVRKHTIPVIVKKLYTDVDGVVIDKNTIPAAIQKKVPVFLLGGFDLEGGYKIGLQSIAPDENLKYLLTFVNGKGSSFANVVGFSGLSTIQGYLKTGDIVQVYTDDLLNPSYFIWIVVQNTYASIASIIGNTESTQNDKRIGPIMIEEIHYKADIEDQLKEAIQILHYSNIGTWRANQIDPLGMYRTPFDVQTGLVRIPLKPLLLTQYFGLAMSIVFDSDSFQIDFKILTV